MRRIPLLPAFAAFAVIAANAAQTPTTPAPKPATPKSATTATTAKPGTRPAASAASAVKLPPGVPVVKGVLKTAFSLRYEDFKIGTGVVAEPGKIYKVHYTGWLASDGKKFDSSYDHRRPVMDKDGKPEMDADGKPKLGDPEPLSFPQGHGRLIPGWDQGFEGMKVGGKRRLFIPYQLAYGATGRPPMIPAKSDLIFDVELVDVTDMPAQPAGMPGGRPMPPRPGVAPGSAPGTPSTPPAPAPAAKPADPANSATPSTAPSPASPSSTPVPATAPQPASPTAPPDKPANPAQPK